MYDVVSLAEYLCAIPSISHEEGEACRALLGVLRDMGYEVHTQQVGSEDRFNIFAHHPNVTPRILLTSHIDTVPPFIAPTRSADQEWLLGRGVCDAKGIVASMIMAANALRAQGVLQVGLLFVVGEETISDGAKLAATGFAPKVDYFINGEPTDLCLATRTKGAVAFELKTQGVAGHSAYPETGHSAIHQLIEDSAALLKHDWPEDPDFGATTLNLGQISGGVGANVIAPWASARGVLRTSVPASGLIDQMHQCLSLGSKLNVLTASSPMRFQVVDGFESCVVSFGTDIPHLAGLGAPLLYGPGSILDAHTAHEKVRIQDLHKAVDGYCRLVTELLLR